MVMYYQGEAPSACDIRRCRITDRFVDGSTRMGPWANMCPDCHKIYGYGFGIGRGQEYTKQDNGKWLKTKG